MSFRKMVHLLASCLLLFSVGCSAASTPQATATSTRIPAKTSTETPIPLTATGTSKPSPIPDPRAGWTYFTNVSDYARNSTFPVGLIPDAENGMMEAIAGSPDGSIWVNNRLRGGVSRFDGNQWITYPPTPDLPLDWVFDIDVASDGTIWLAGPKNVLLGNLDGEWVTTSFAGTGYQGYVHGLEVSLDGTIWLLAGSHGVLYRQGNAWKKLSLDSLLSYTEDDNVVNAIAASPDGSVWFGTDAGIAHYQNGKLTITPTPGVDIISLLVTRSGDIWSGAIDEYTGPPGGRDQYYFLSRWNDSGEEKHLVGEFVFAMSEGPEGVLWFATNNGLFRYDGGTWEHWDRENGPLQTSILDIYAAPDGSVWMVSGDFVFHYQPISP